MNRRDFIKTTGVAATVAAAPTILKAAGAPRVFKVGIVGCGGRGNGALQNIHNAAKMLTDEGCPVEIKVVAAADHFLGKAEGVAKKFPGCKAFGGCNGYKEVMKSDAEIVILTTPLNFRPIHTMAAIQAGKHVFAEKGVAVDPAGCRLMIAASKLAKEKGLSIVAGTQRRHQRGYRLIADALEKGLVSPILGGNVYWNGAVPWVRNRDAGWNNRDYLCANWLNFTELSGDHICEQHVHNIDIANWYIGRYPKSALGFGARARRVSGNQYDMFSIDFDYGEGVHIHSMCRQIDGCSGGGVCEIFRTKDSTISGGGAVRMINGKKLELTGNFRSENPYDVEHYDLLRSIMKTGPYFNEGEAVAMSTLCGVIGRISCYTGKIVTMASVLKDEKSEFYNMDCIPRPADFEQAGDVPMPSIGDNEWALPGRPWRGLAKDAKTSNKATFGAPTGIL